MIDRGRRQGLIIQHRPVLGGPLDESRTHTPYWNPGLSRARLPVPPQGVVPTQHSPSLAYKELKWAIQLCIQHSTSTNTMLRDLDQPAR